jgi:hypothetical protein
LSTARCHFARHQYLNRKGLEKNRVGQDYGHVSPVAIHFAHSVEEHGECSSLLITLVLLTVRRHGPLSDCPISVTESLVSEYMNLDEDSVKRLVIERRYGKATVHRLVAKFEEEKSNAEWFKSSTMACPGCHVNVEKSVGCNHVSPIDHDYLLVLTDWAPR